MHLGNAETVGEFTGRKQLKIKKERKAKMPVERMRMRPWLEEQINGNTIPGLKWLNEEMKIFQIPWMHAARHGWDVEKDAPLFRNWAIHTGKYQPGVDKADPKTWKANFRCAMNSLPDIEEVKDKSIKKGNNAYRVYRMLPLSERPTKKAKKIKMDGKEEKEEPMIYIKQEFLDSSFPETNGVCQAYDYGESSNDIKSEVDSTVNIIIVGSRTADMEDEMIVSNPPDVCQVVEVTTESEEQNAGGNEHYPLQISPAYSYAESETDSAPSDEEKIAAMAMARLLWETPCKSEKPAPCSTGARGATHSVNSTQTIVTSNKPDLQVTIKEECAPLPYNSSWPKFPETLPSSQVGSSASTSSKPDRVSVIKKTSDITQARVKSY